MKSRFLSQFWFQFWAICKLQQGPEFVPTHPLFMGLIIIANLLLSTGNHMQVTHTDPLPTVLALYTVNLAIIGIITWIALFLKNCTYRFRQTLSAMITCDLIITLFAAGIILFSGQPENELIKGITVLLNIWLISIWGYILHHALNISVLQGTALAIAFTFTGFLFAGALTLPMTTAA